jgi:hypothetical protein
MAVTFVGAGTFTTVEAGAGSLVVPFPAGVVAGDFAILVVYYVDTTTGEVSTISSRGSFTQQASASLSPLDVSTKVCSGGDSSNTISYTSSGGTAFVSAQMLVYRGVNTSSPIDSASAASLSLTSSATFPAITSSVVGSAGIHIVVGSSGLDNPASGTAPATWTELTDIATDIAANPRYATTQIEHKLNIALSEPSVTRAFNTSVSGTRASFSLTATPDSLNTLFFGMNY